MKSQEISLFMVFFFFLVRWLVFFWGGEFVWFFGLVFFCGGRGSWH